MSDEQDSGLEIDSELEETIQGMQEEVDSVDTDSRKTPEAVRRGVKAHAEARDPSELASRAQSVSSRFSRNIEQQNNLAEELEEMVDRARDATATQNLEVHRFTADAEATGRAGVEEGWEFDSEDFLREDGELLESAEAGQSLQSYAQSVSSDVQEQSATVQTATTIMGERSREISETKEEYGQKLDQAEQELEDTIEEAESQYEEGLAQAEEEKEEALDDIMTQIINQTDSDIEDSEYESTAEMSGEESREVQEEFRETEESLEEELEEKKKEARAEYEETVEELEEERARDVEMLKEEKDSWKQTKQEALEERNGLLDDVEAVHADFSEEVVQYVQDRAEEVDNITRTLGALENMAGDFNEEGIVNDDSLRGDFNLGQNGVIEDVENAAASLASRALENIDYLEDAVHDYADFEGAMPELLDEMSDRAGSRLDEVTDLYDQLGVEVEDDVEDEYGVEALRNRVKQHVEGAKSEDYDSVDSFRRQIRAEAETPT